MRHWPIGRGEYSDKVSMLVWSFLQDVKASCDQVALALAERGGQALVVWQSLLQRGVVEDEAGTQAMYSLNKQIDKTMVGDMGGEEAQTSKYPCRQTG